MITRVIHTDIFKDKNFRKLNADTKMFYLTLILNDEIGQSRIYKCSDEFLAIYSGLTLTQVDKCKDDLEVAQMAIFKDDYVCISCDVGYVDSYYSGSKNDGAKIKEIERIPSDVLEYFLTILDTLSIGYRYYIDSLINNKSKSKYKSTQKNDFVDKPVDNYRYDDGKAKEFFESVKKKMIVRKRERKHIPKIEIDDSKIDRTDRWRVAKCDEVWVRNSAGDAVRKHLV